MQEYESYNGFSVTFYAGMYHAASGNKRTSAERIADVYRQIDELMN